jgi:hypothetical protein
MKKEDAEKFVKRQKEFYLDLIVYIFVCLVFTGIWLIYDHGSSFWPKYIYFWGGVYIVYRFIRSGNLAFLSGFIPFTAPDWEEKQITKLTSKQAKSAPTKRVKNRPPVKQRKVILIGKLK